MPASPCVRQFAPSLTIQLVEDQENLGDDFLTTFWTPPGAQPVPA